MFFLKYYSPSCYASNRIEDYNVQFEDTVTERGFELNHCLKMVFQTLQTDH